MCKSIERIAALSAAIAILIAGLAHAAGDRSDALLASFASEAELGAWDSRNHSGIGVRS